MGTTSITTAERNQIKALAKHIAKPVNINREITKTACKAELKQAGIKQALFENLFDEVSKIKTSQRDAASKLKLAIKNIAIKVNPGDARINFTKEMALLALKVNGLKKSMAVELVRVVKQLEVDRIAIAALDVYRDSYRYPVSVHGQESVNGVDDPALVGVSQTQSNDWDLYRGSFKGRPATVTDTLIKLPMNWMSRVFAEGISLVDGLMTLDASPLPAPLGCKLYAAKWVMQGRGYSVSVESGYIAKGDDGTAYHADSTIKAIKGLTKKSATVARDAEWIKLFDVDSIENLAAKLPANAVVSIGDAKAVGACDYGIKSWCFSTGLPYIKGRAPMAEVIQAYRKEPRMEARAAILHALRKSRAMAKVAA